MKPKWQSVVIGTCMIIASAALALMVMGGGHASSAAAKPIAPDWLPGGATEAMVYFEARSTNTVEWSLSTVAEYDAAVQITAPSSADDAARQFYVVVLHGDFISKLPQHFDMKVPSDPVRGPVLVLLFDPVTRELTNMDLLRSESVFSGASLAVQSTLVL